MEKTNDTTLIEGHNGDVKLLGAEVMRHRRESAKVGQKGVEVLQPEYSIGELRRFAQMVIDERIKFCECHKKDEPLEKCVCDAVERYIRLFKESTIKGDKRLRELRVEAIQKLFEEMKREGKIKCTGDSTGDK